MEKTTSIVDRHNCYFVKSFLKKEINHNIYYFELRNHTKLTRNNCSLRLPKVKL